MSEISEEEKRRILRERRAAKFAKGGAGSRLNKIVNNNDSSLQVDSPLDKPKAPTPLNTSVPASTSASHDDDPEIVDISEVADPLNDNKLSRSNTDMDKDLEKMLSSIFQGAPAPDASSDAFNDELLKNFLGGSANAGNPFGNATDSENDAFSSLFSSLVGGAPSADGTPMPGLTEEEIRQQQVVTAYNKYKSDSLNYRFMITRLIALSTMLFYTIFKQQIYSSSYDYVRLQNIDVKQPFYTLFLTFEFIILSTYYVIVTKKGDAHYQDSIIAKGMNFLQIIPIVNQYKGTILNMVKYQQLLMMFVKDLAFVVLIFGLVSFMN